MPWRPVLPTAVAVVGVVAAALYVASVPPAVRDLADLDAPGLADLGLSGRGYALYVVVLVSVLAAVHLVVAGLLLRLAGRRPAAASSALVLVCLGVVFPQTLPALAASRPGWSAAVEVLEAGTVVALTLWVLTFPDGRFRPSWTAWFAGAVAVEEGAALLGFVPEAWEAGLTAGWVAVLLVVTVLRYRSASDDDARAGVRWVAAGTAVALAGLVIAGVAQDLLGARPGTVADLAVQGLLVLAFLCLPGAVAAALLRHGMWGVEASVARAVTYGALTVAATAAYTTVVAAGTAVLPLDPTATATGAAGLLALAVHPAYVRLRRGVDRLFYGDGRRAVAQLSSLADRRPDDPAGLVTSVCEVLAATLRLPFVSVVVGTPDDPVTSGSAGTLAPGWPTESVELRHLGDRVGTLVVARRDPTGAVVGPDLAAIADVARQLSVLASSLLLAERLRQSRSRLVTAREEERRRLRNDLHDGLGPALSGVLLTLAAAENRLPDGAAPVTELLGEARAQTAAAVADVRRLVYGLRPPSLDELGLAGTVRALLARLGAGGVGFRTEISGDLEELPAAVEVAAYRIVSEAATNVVRHSRAHACTVTLRRTATELEVTVADDGTGCSGERGVGLTSMAERAAELGGSFSVAAGVDGGTTVRAVLPLVPSGVPVEPVAHG